MVYYRNLPSRTQSLIEVLEKNEHFLKSYRAFLANPGANGNYFPTQVPAVAPGPESKLPVLHPRHQQPLTNYNVPPMSVVPASGIQPEILPNTEGHEERALAETALKQRPTFNPHNPSPTFPQNGSMLPERQFYPRGILPQHEEATFGQYMPVYQNQAGYPDMPMFDNYNGRELPPGPRPAFRVESDYVLVGREPRRLEQTWSPNESDFFDGVNNVMPQFANNTEEMFGPGDRRAMGADRTDINKRASSCSRADEQELEEKLDALARHIDTELKSAD